MLITLQDTLKFLTITKCDYTGKIQLLISDELNFRKLFNITMGRYNIKSNLIVEEPKGNKCYQRGFVDSVNMIL